MALITRHIFLDTQVFIASNFDYTGQRFLSLIEWVEKEKVFIYLTDITKREIHANITKRADAATAELKKLRTSENLRILINLNGPYQQVIGTRPDKKAIIEELVSQFESFEEKASVDYIDTDSVSISDIFERYFTNIPPFGSGNKKSEFPDAFVIASLADWCENNSKKMYVISGDKDMIAAAKLSSHLVSISQIDQFLDELIHHEQTFVHDTIKAAYIRDQEQIILDIRSQFEDSEFYLDELDGEVDIVNVKSVNISEWSIIDIDEWAGRATLNLKVLLEYKAEVSYAQTMIEDMTFGHEEADIEADTRLSVKVDYVFDTDNLDEPNPEVESVSFNKKPIFLSLWPDDHD